MSVQVNLEDYAKPWRPGIYPKSTTVIYNNQLWILNDTITGLFSSSDFLAEVANGDWIGRYTTEGEFADVAYSGDYNDLINIPPSSSTSILIREEFIFSGSQTFTLINNYAQVYSVEVQGQGALSTSQYTLVAPNQVTINDTLDVGDYVVIIYSDASVGVVPYYTQAQVDVFLALKENLAKNITTIDSNYTISSNDMVVICETNSFNVILPSAISNSGRKLTITSISSGVITLLPFGAETIQGDVSQEIYNNETFDLISNGTNWLVI